METFSALLALCVGNSPVTGEFPEQRPVTRTFDVSLICAWTNTWANNGDAGDLRRHRAHYDVIVVQFVLLIGACRSSCCDHVPRWMSRSLGGIKSSLVKLIAWCRQATRHYLNQCRPGSIVPYDVICGHSELMKVLSDDEVLLKESSWWRHQMETFSALLAICAGPVNSPQKGQWRGALMYSLICVWINGWVNNRKAGDLRRYRAHYDVIVTLIELTT